jgi:hypothetical protein
MGNRINIAARVLVACVANGLGAYTLGSAVAGHQDPGLAGCVSGRRYSYLALDQIDAAPTNWVRGIGVLALTNGNWTLTREVVRRNLAGTTDDVSWPFGTIYIALIADPIDSPVFDTDGWFGLGGTPGRAFDSPLDIQGQNSAGAIALFKNTAGSVRVNVSDAAIYSLIPIQVPAPADPKDATRKDYTDNIANAKTTIGQTVWAGAGTGGFDPGQAETIFISTHKIPAKTVQIMAGINIRGLPPAAPASIYARLYIISPTNTIIYGPYGIAVSAGVGQFPALGKFVGINLPSGTIPAADYTLRLNLFRDNPINVLEAEIISICIAEG